jgi:exopolyphosphatase/guanosine-5'-triphosphate,3'-diphosphate pyrophosphatase
VRRACIDIGSNTTRLLVAECDGPRLLEIHQERAFTRIGAALRHDGTIGPDKLDEVCRVVGEQLASAIALGAVEVRCVATASIRRAANGEELVGRIRAHCDGLRVDVLSGQEEARLAFVGAARTLDHEPEGLLGVVDVGGGSSELVVGAVPSDVEWWASFPIGSGDIADDCLRSDPPSTDDFADARRRVDEVLRDVRPPRTAVAVAVGGSATSLRRLVGPVLDPEAFERSLHLLASRPATDVARRFALDRERVKLMPAGLLILEAVSRLFAAPLQIGRGGVREGVLLEAGA